MRFCDGENAFSAVFRVDEKEGFPRGFWESLQQRFELLQHTLLSPEEERYRITSGENGEVNIYCPFLEGEVLVTYLRRISPASEDLSLRLVGDIIDVLLRFVRAPRLLAGLSLDDFLVCVRDGIRLESRVFIVPSLLRTEQPKSDFQIAEEWIGTVSRLFLAVKAKWQQDLLSHDPALARPFRKLLKDLREGKEKPLVDRLVELRKVVFSEVSRAKKSDLSLRFAGGGFPTGELSERFLSESSHERPEMRRVHDFEIPVQFSHFMVEVDSGQGDRKVCYLAPPDEWVDAAVVDSVNRKMSHSFLHAHHNGIRIRSVLCQDSCTALFANPPMGLPLPSLLRFRGGLSYVEFLFLFNKVHRALSQFDSADFEFDLRSPWQIQLHPESAKSPSEWEKMLGTDIRDWPSWDIKVRVELPMEYLLDLENSPSWKGVYRRLGRKFFPALVCWIMDWQRFELAFDTGKIDSEVLSRDERFNAMFEAARKFLDALDIEQRENFLRLVEEGVRGIIQEPAEAE